ncbi:MAG TPA: hypothetical protein VLA12_19605 [Planctomycetaceae bacterium]|nr:hypothetical protein [Planctomycetaceae bacterium]
MNWEDLVDKYSGSVWLVCGGPSMRGFDFSELRGPTAAVNQIGALFEPDFWFGNDELEKYPLEFWQTPTIKLLRDGVSHRPTGDNIVYYDATSHDRALRGDFLTSPRVVWSAPARWHGGVTVKKSVMLAAIGALYRLGFREIVLIGCDWSQSLENPYGHDLKQMDEELVRFSNRQFRIMDQWFCQLEPLFRHHCLKIINATDGGGLEIFERADWREISRKWKNQPELAEIDREI